MRIGLQGVELGNHLIKKAVDELKKEFFGLQQFSSLSPIPGFRLWPIDQINREIQQKSERILEDYGLKVLEINTVVTTTIVF